MKKIVKVLLLFVLIASLVVVFASCGDEPTTPGNDTPGDNTGDQPGDNPSGGSTDNDDTNKATYTVKFRVNGAVVNTQTVVEGQCATRPATDPTPKNVEQYFAGWYFDGEEFDFTTPITEDMGLNAFFTDIYVITFLDAEGGPLDTTTVKYHKNIDTAAVPNAPTAPENYHFAGWIVDGEVISTKTLVEMEIDHLITAQVKYEINTYQVRFYSTSDNSTLSVVRVNAGSTVTQYVPEYGTISSYKVNGSEYDFSTPVTSQLDIACKQERTIHTITFVDKEGVKISDKKAFDGTTISVPVSSSVVYSCDSANLAKLTKITEDRTVVLTAEEKSAYTASFEPNMKTDIVEKDINWAKSGVTYYLAKAGQYFEYKGYFSEEFVINVCSGAKFQAEEIVSVFKVYCDGLQLNTITFGTFNCPGTTDNMPITACVVPAGEHTIRVEVASTTFDPAFMPVGGNENDYGIGITKVVTNQDLSKVYYTVKFVNNYEDEAFSTEQMGVVAELKVQYGATATLPTMPGALHEYLDEQGVENGGEEFDGWWDEDGLFSFRTGNQPTYADTTWYVKYTMKKTYDVTFKNKSTGETICVSNTLWGSNAALPQDSTYYYIVDSADIAKIYGVKGAATVEVTPVKKNTYSQQNIVITKSYSTQPIWQKYSVTLSSKDPENITSPALQNYAAMLYKVGQTISITGNFAGKLQYSMNADKVGQEYKVRMYVDGVAAWTSELICYNAETGKWNQQQSLTIPEIAAGVHTITFELVYANDDKCETKLQGWAGLAFSQIIIQAQ